LSATLFTLSDFTMEAALSAKLTFLVF